MELMTCGELPLLAIDCKPALFGKLEGKLPRDIGSIPTTLAFATLNGDTFGGDCRFGLLLTNWPAAIESALLTRPLFPYKRYDSH